LYGPNQAFNIQANGQLMNAEAFRSMIVTWRNGAPVRLGEIADVIDSVENTRNMARRYTAEEEGQRAIMLQVMRQPGSNTVEVADSIAMLQIIVRHNETSEAPLAAALRGSKEVGFTFVSMTISLAAVFIPVLFMGGVLGRLFREFAVTITTAVLISGVVSITLT